MINKFRRLKAFKFSCIKLVGLSFLVFFVVFFQPNLHQLNPILDSSYQRIDHFYALAQAPQNSSTPSIEGSTSVDESIKSKRTTSEPGWFIPVVIFTFAWVLVGVSLNYGIRMYCNAPIHPSFIPFIVVTNAVIISFSVVLALDITSGGDIEFNFLGQQFSGASGPAVLWVLTFLTIMIGFRLVNASELASSDIEAYESTHKLLFASRDRNKNNPQSEE